MFKDEDIKWYHGNLSREAAENLLRECNVDGAFLVRESTSSVGDFVLSVLHNNDICHFQIRKHSEDAFFSIDENTKIHGLETLIDHYMHTNDALSEGLVLKQPIKGEPPPLDVRLQGTPRLIHRATSEGDCRIVSLILKATPDLMESKNSVGQTPAHLASMKGLDDILRILIELGANVNCRDRAGNTPLHYACQNNLTSTVRLLVNDGGANIQARNTETGDVPLHEAASRGHKEVVQELLSLNAPVNPRNKDNKLPSELARINGFIECAIILENYKPPSPKTRSNLWYHGTLDRNEAEIIIRQFGTENGTFLVRWSERNRENVLTLMNDDMLKNYIIRKKDNYLFIDNGPYLDSLEHIIDYYSTIADGLPTVLKIPVPPKPKPPVPEFSTIPRQRKKTENQTVNTIIDQFQNIKFKTNLGLISNNNNNNDDDDNSTTIINNNNDENVDSLIAKLTFGPVIGEGEFGSVIEGTYIKKSGVIIPVAIKKLRNEHLKTNKDAFLREAEVMRKLNHHCIVKFIDLSIGETCYMVQELVRLGSLLQYLVNHKERINQDYNFKIWAAQIACGMNYLEEQKFLHRDLAARNILLATPHQAKISDFGLSRALGCDHDYYKAKQGGKWPLKWYAPESYNFGTFSHKSDVWSFGVTIWEMYSFGDTPYGDMKGSEVIKLIDQGLRLEQPQSCPNHIYEIMKQCWDSDPDKRPTFNELSQKFSSDLEYTNLRELLSEANLA